MNDYEYVHINYTCEISHFPLDRLLFCNGAIFCWVYGSVMMHYSFTYVWWCSAVKIHMFWFELTYCLWVWKGNLGQPSTNQNQSTFWIKVEHAHRSCISWVRSQDATNQLWLSGDQQHPIISRKNASPPDNDRNCQSCISRNTGFSEGWFIQAAFVVPQMDPDRSLSDV